MYVMKMKKEVCGSKTAIKRSSKRSGANEKLKKSVLETECLFLLFLFYLVFQLFFICDLVRAGNQFKRISDRHYLFCKRRICPVHASLYGFISDKLGLKKKILFMISCLLIFTGPFYIFVYGPLLQYNVFLGAVVGGLYLGAAFLAGIGAIETYIEKVSRKYDFEYGKSRMWGSLGWAAVAFLQGAFSISIPISTSGSRLFQPSY